VVYWANGELQLSRFALTFDCQGLQSFGESVNGGETMKIVIQLNKREEEKALPILLRHSPGMMLPDRTYVLGVEAVKALREAGVGFTELSREASAPGLEGVGTSERI
jgi:hypothetical protein